MQKQYYDELEENRLYVKWPPLGPLWSNLAKAKWLRQKPLVRKINEDCLSNTPLARGRWILHTFFLDSFQVPARVSPYSSWKLLVFCGIHAPRTPMWYFTDIESTWESSMASHLGKVRFWKTHPKHIGPKSCVFHRVSLMLRPYVSASRNRKCIWTFGAIHYSHILQIFVLWSLGGSIEYASARFLREAN